MSYVYHGHHPSLVVDAVNDPIDAPARAEPVVHRRKQPLPDLVGVFQKRARDEFLGGCRNGFRQSLPQRATDGRGCPKLILFLRPRSLRPALPHHLGEFLGGDIMDCLWPSR